jgi:REP element-mobilizing transposase RayT
MELRKRKQIRLSEFDYSTPSAYFITVCTRNRENLFWKNADGFVESPQQVVLTDLGEITRRSIGEIPRCYPGIRVDNFVIMPDHVHLLLQLITDADGQRMAAPSVSTVIRMMKSTVSKQAGFSVWQKGFYDHVIRNKKDYGDVWNYINGNVSKRAERR